METIDEPAKDTGNWQDYAAGKGLDSDLFFPERGDDATVTAAKEVCATCPVTDECLAYANTPPIEVSGIWGGLSPRQRRELRNTRKQVA